jgi:hypothetical protein
MAHAERRERQKGVRYRGMYQAADGRYRSAGTFSTEERALEVAKEAERRAAEVIGGAAGGLDPGIRATRTIKEYAPLFLRHHRVEGNTKDTYADTLRLHVVPFLGSCRVAETDRTVARNYITALLVDYNPGASGTRPVSRRSSSTRRSRRLTPRSPAMWSPTGSAPPKDRREYCDPGEQE